MNYRKNIGIRLTKSLDNSKLGKLFIHCSKSGYPLDNENINTGLDLNLPGYHEIEWDGKNQDGIPVGNGNYFYQIRVKNNKAIIERTGKILKIQ